jgi:hypothetical protein
LVRLKSVHHEKLIFRFYPSFHLDEINRIVDSLNGL